MTYEVIENNPMPDIIKATSKDGTVFWIPTDPSNSDYQAYLASQTDQ